MSTVGERITESELAALTRAAGTDRVLPLKFGPGWVEIDACGPSAGWALDMLRVIRASQAP